MNALETIAEELNCRSESHPIHRLQEIRKVLKGHSKLASRKIFESNSIREDYAFHWGGRTELQFNIGWETINGVKRFRHGVAFSLEPSQTLPDIAPLLPKIARFNEFVRIYHGELARFRMWHYANDTRSENYAVCEIPSELAKINVFIFLGYLAPTETPDYEMVLNDFDLLLSLYQFVEGKEEFPIVAPMAGFKFTPGCSIKPSFSKSSLPERTLDINLRHNEIQLALHDYLVSRYGPDAVGTEISSGAGTRIDVVLNKEGKYHFFEIKTSQSARSCIRDALSQLLEYSYWPGTQEAERLIIIGEAESTHESRTFLSMVRERFSLPIYYHQYNLYSNELIE